MGCDAVHIAGDLAYAYDSFPPGPEEEWIWDAYVQEQTKYALKYPWMTTCGNHEQFANATAYKNRFRMPGIISFVRLSLLFNLCSSGPESQGNASFFYSYNVGPVHIISFTTDGPPSKQPGSPQYKWLEADLGKVDRNLTPWVVFVTHRPVFCSAKGEFGQHAGEQALLEPVFLKYGVDLVIVGHMHIYERIYPNIDGKPVVSPGSNTYVNPNCPSYVVQGTGGSFLGSGGWVEPQPAWSAVRTGNSFFSDEYGYGRMVANRTVLTYQFYQEKNDEIFDEFAIIKR